MRANVERNRGLTRHDLAHLDNLERLLGNLSIRSSDPAVLAELAVVLGGDLVGCYEFERDGDQAMLARWGSSSELVPDRYYRRMRDGLASGEMGFLFSMRHVEREQRNRVVLVPGARTLSGYGRRKLEYLGLDALPGPLQRTIALHEQYGIAEHNQMRVVICDGALPLGYLNLIQAAPFRRRQRRAFAAALRLLGRRRMLDRRLADADAHRATIDVALESLGRAAFLVDKAGQVIHANALGVVALSRETSRREIRDAIQGRSVNLDATPIRSANGMPWHYLVIGKHPRLPEVAAALAHELGLRQRATEVLVLVADGNTTTTIAAKLGVAENTVEYHLTRVFRRLGVTSRSELQRALAERTGRGCP